MDTLVQDVRHSLRSLVRTPGFAIAAVLSLAIGIGANAAIFTVASALLLASACPTRIGRSARHPLEPVAGTRDRRGLVLDRAVLGHPRGPHRVRGPWRSRSAPITTSRATAPPERVGTIRVSSNLLPMLGARAAARPAVRAAEDAPGRAGTAMLGHGTWMRRYGGDSSAVGRTLILNGQPYEIVGVLPASFSLARAR